MSKYCLSALAAAGLLAGGLTVSSASAADLGGNCCADLEERIAELEATTARKGNRRVSLTISGWVGEQVMWWDDGAEDNVYVTGLGSTLATNVKFTGQATISPGWSAGYVIHVEADGNTPRDTPSGLLSDQDTAHTNLGVVALQTFWFLKSEQLGKLSVGRQSQASDNTAILVDGSGSLLPANWVTFTGDFFFLRNSATGLYTTFRWSDLMYCSQVGTGVGGDCNGVPLNSVRYDSPTFAGFSVSASWGEDDFWDVAARYAGEFAGFKLAIAAAYSHSNDALLIGLPTSFGAADNDYFQVGAYLQHVPTGLFLYGAYGTEDNSQLNPSAFDADGNPTAGVTPLDGNVWYVKGGIRQRWTPLGHTVLYGLYGENDDKLSGPLQAFGAPDFTSSEMKMWGLGVVQEIDGAAMSFWVHYQQYFDGEVSGPGGTLQFEDLDTVKAGALINF